MPNIPPIDTMGDHGLNAIKKNDNIKNNSSFFLQRKEIDLIDLKETNNIESFCKYFFICSFPYNNGKIIENSQNYMSTCGHQNCSKLLSFEPVITYKYPLDDNDLELDNLSASICFPTGIKLCYNQERNFSYKSFSTHIFNQQKQKYYMSVYLFYRQLEANLFEKLYLDNPLKIYLKLFGNKTFKEKDKEKLEKDLAICEELAFGEYVYIPYALVLISKYPYIKQMNSCLNVIYKIFTNNEENSALINNLLAYLIYGIPIPNKNCEISFNMPLNLSNITIGTPYKSDNKNTENFDFLYILSNLSVENIITIFKLMLFEKRILFIDKDCNELSKVIDSFIKILYPFDWKNAIIPIMSVQMTRYLLTFLPFINGMSREIYDNNGNSVLEEAEEGVFQIYIEEDKIKFSKKNNEEEALSSIPDLPKKIHKKLYSELNNLKIIMKDKVNKVHYDNINNIVKNIFLESISILFYGLISQGNEYKGLINKIIEIYEITNKKEKKEALRFYKEFTETQLFQNFIQNFTKNKKDYSLFICMIKNIKEKYCTKKLTINLDKIIRNVEKSYLVKIPIIFKIPLHLLNKDDENSINTYILEKEEWTIINNNLKNKKKSKILSDDIIPEKDRIALIINQIDNKFNPPKEKMERFFFPENNKDNYNYNIAQRDKRIISLYNSDKSKIYDKLLIKLEQNSILSKDEQTIIKRLFTDTITSLLKNIPVAHYEDIEYCLNYVYFNLGRDMLCQLLYKKGFRFAKKLKEDCFEYLYQICINAFNSMNQLEENQNILECAVKITSSAFYYCKEKTNIYLIDKIRNNLGKNYAMWNKKTFWNTWLDLEDYYIINEYNIYCEIIVHDFANKLIQLQLDNDFILNYIISTLAEKMILLDHTFKLNQETITKNQVLFNEYRQKIIEIVENNNNIS